MKYHLYILSVLFFCNGHIAKGSLANDMGQSIKLKFTKMCDSINIETQKFILKSASNEYADKYSSLRNNCDNIDLRGSKTSLRYLLRSENLLVNLEICRKIERKKRKLRASLNESNYSHQLDVFKEYCFETLNFFRRDEVFKQSVHAMDGNENIKIKTDFPVYVNTILILYSLDALSLSVLLLFNFL